jgi:hypothetical protein
MTKAWKRLIFVHLPLAVLTLAVLAQLLAAGLSHFPVRRDVTDDLALAVESSAPAPRVMLLGDSITAYALSDFELGRDPSDVMNVATNKWAGFMSQVLLLQRELRSHAPPSWVVIATTPEDFGDAVDPRVQFHFNWYPFDRADEHQFLRDVIPGIDRLAMRPAVLDYQTDIFERFSGVVRRGSVQYQPPARIPAAAAQESPSNVASEAGIELERRLEGKLHVNDIHRALLLRLCRLEKDYHFAVAVVWPPAPKVLVEKWRSTHELDKLAEEISTIFNSENCRPPEYYDINSFHSFNDFDQDSVHVRGPETRELFGALLRSYVVSLPPNTGGG